MSEVSELKRIADALEKLVNHTCGANQPASNTKLHGVKAAVQVTKVEEVKPEPEEDVTEDVLRARAADVCALSPDGKAKADVVAVVKKICGGKIADLKDAKQRVKALAELDKLYDKYNVKSEEDDV